MWPDPCKMHLSFVLAIQLQSHQDDSNDENDKRTCVFPDPWCAFSSKKGSVLWDTVAKSI